MWDLKCLVELVSKFISNRLDVKWMQNLPSTQRILETEELGACALDRQRNYIRYGLDRSYIRSIEWKNWPEKHAGNSLFVFLLYVGNRKRRRVDRISMIRSAWKQSKSNQLRTHTSFWRSWCASRAGAGHASPGRRWRGGWTPAWAASPCPWQRIGLEGMEVEGVPAPAGDEEERRSMSVDRGWLDRITF
jgi:hypothetical protein